MYPLYFNQNFPNISAAFKRQEFLKKYSDGQKKSPTNSRRTDILHAAKYRGDHFAQNLDKTLAKALGENFRGKLSGKALAKISANVLTKALGETPRGKLSAKVLTKAPGKNQSANASAKIKLFFQMAVCHNSFSAGERQNKVGVLDQHQFGSGAKGFGYFPQAFLRAGYM